MLRSCGYEICKSEELKITIKTKSYGYYGVEFAEQLKDKGLICEYSDPDFVVMMLTPENENRLDEIPLVMKSLPARTPITSLPPVLKESVRMIGVREAYFSDYEEISAEMASRGEYFGLKIKGDIDINHISFGYDGGNEVLTKDEHLFAEELKKIVQVNLKRVYSAINYGQVYTNWCIGKRIFEQEQKG